MAAEQLPVTALVPGVQEVETTKKRVGGQLRGAENVTASIDLRLTETKELIGAAGGIAPDPPVQVR